MVTGASSGIGAAIAKSLASAGLRVAVGARRQERLTSLADELNAVSGGRQVWGHVLDVREPASIDAFYRSLDDYWGPVQVLVNNAGVGFRGTQWEQASEEWAQMIDVNVVGLLRMTQAALQRMEDSGNEGHIFHVSSMSGHRLAPRTSVYSATKHAVKALTEGLRLDLREAGRPVRVTSVSPGFVETDFLDAYTKSAAEAQRIKDAYPLLKPEDVASAVVYALSAPPHMQVHDVLMRPTEQPN